MEHLSDSIQTLTQRLMRIINKHSRIEKLPIQFGEHFDLTAKEVHCIQAVGLKQRCNIKQLGERLGVTKSAASQMIGKLEKKGVVTKEKAPDSYKELEITLTDSGWKAFEAHKKFHERHFVTLKERLGDFSDPQIATAGAILSVVESVVDERIEELFGESPDVE